MLLRPFVWDAAGSDIVKQRRPVSLRVPKIGAFPVLLNPAGGRGGAVAVGSRRPVSRRRECAGVPRRPAVRAEHLWSVRWDGV